MLCPSSNMFFPAACSQRKDLKWICSKPFGTYVCKTQRMHVFSMELELGIWFRGMLQKTFFAQMCGCPKRILGLLNRMLVPGDRQSCWQHWGGGAPLSITLLCSFLFFSALFYGALLCPILPCSTLLCSSEPLCQLPANHRLTCKKPPPIEFPGFFLWLAGSPYLASQCLHVRRTWPPVWIFFA